MRAATPGSRQPEPGKPDESLLIKAVKYTDENLKMPPKGKLSDEQIADLTKWVKDGAKWPNDSAKVNPGHRKAERPAVHTGTESVLGLSEGEGTRDSSQQGQREPN